MEKAALHMNQLSSLRCGGPSRRDLLKVGGLGLCGLTLPSLIQARTARGTESSGRGRDLSRGHAKSCIVLFFLGGPPQHETWDPKPDAPSELRGPFKPISTNVPGVHICELMPRTARLMDKIAVLRACQTGDNAHSTSGYAMSTGVSHLPLGQEGAAPGAPNNHPCLPATVKHLFDRRRGNQPGGLPASIVLPEICANDGNKTWPGQDGGFLGRAADPWVLQGDPSKPGFTVQDLVSPPGVDPTRCDDRRSLLKSVDRWRAQMETGGVVEQFDAWRRQAYDLVASPAARKSFDLSAESSDTRDRYGRTKFGQGVLLARRLVEAGVSLVQVNWSRLEGAPNNGHWDTHAKNAESMKNWLAPIMDQAYSALLEDLGQRGLLDETLVVWAGEFGRTPKINANGGRDHWGNVFSTALAGGGIRGGQVHGASDRLGGEPVAGRVTPADIHATIYHCLGFSPQTEIHNTSGRPLPISRGSVIHPIV